MTGTLYFNVNDVSAYHDQVRERVQVVWPLEDMEYGTREFGISDRDGYTLAFAEVLRR